MRVRTIIIIAVSATVLFFGTIFAVLYYFMASPEDPEMEEEALNYLQNRYDEEFEVTYGGYHQSRGVHFLYGSPVEHDHIEFRIDQRSTAGMRDDYLSYRWNELNLDEMLSNEVRSLFSDAEYNELDIVRSSDNIGIMTRVFLALEENDIEWEEEEERIYELVNYYDEKNIYGLIQVHYENMGVKYELELFNEDEDINDIEDVADYKQEIE